MTKNRWKMAGEIGMGLAAGAAAQILHLRIHDSYTFATLVAVVVGAGAGGLLARRWLEG